MQLTKRFFIMNAMALLASLALTILAFMVFAAAYTKVFGPAADLGGLQRSLEARSAIGQIRREAQLLEFERLLDKSYQRRLSEQVKTIGAKAVILENRKVLYSTDKINELDLEKSLMLSDNSPEVSTIELDGAAYLLARADYRPASGVEGVLLLLAPAGQKTNIYLYAGLFTVGFFVATFLILNFWVSWRFSRSIIAPVSRLRNAAVQISEGDLSGGIAEEGEGEVRELSRTLELMRIKLKESLYLQQKYDENRRFLVSSISHDLKTPVTSIIGYIEGIIDGVAGTPDRMEKYLETARAKAIQVNAMIDDLLLYSKLDLKQIPYHFEKTDLKRYFEDCTADFLYEYEKARIRLSLVSELKEPVFVFIDREQLGRVVQNILDNARKYMDRPDGQVEIRLRETRTSAIIEIRDNGKGISERDLPHIFDRFYRADPSRRSTEGSGLGLAIARQIVEGHDGKIWAQSTVGEGTRMMISLKKV
jgi:signal transduction histidine kinase